jgi:hypothetical protein
MSEYRMLSEDRWLDVHQLAAMDGLSDAQIAGLAIGCPQHGNASMDWDSAGIFCHRCPQHSPGCPSQQLPPLSCPHCG